jgi:hypothetical protein
MDTLFVGLHTGISFSLDGGVCTWRSCVQGFQFVVGIDLWLLEACLYGRGRVLVLPLSSSVSSWQGITVTLEKLTSAFHRPFAVEGAVANVGGLYCTFVATGSSAVVSVTCRL